MKKGKTAIILMFAFLLSGILTGCGSRQEKNILSSGTFEMKKEVLLDKIKGGWAGQTIGVVYGAPTEFKFQGTTVLDYQPIPWDRHYVKYWWDKKPGLFDDVYNDLNFAEAFEKKGLEVSRDTLAFYFANADYHLAHANQASRYNIRQGIMPPASGYWMNNPHADDLDFQIEADFIGLMAPGMVNKATEFADRVGHIMNSGDGWYGGVFVSALYSLAFVTDDVNYLVRQAISTIPDSTGFHECISDVIRWHDQYPGDWQATWYELHKKWNRDKGCPKGVFLSFNIDAKMNSAYVAIGLLYGDGDFTKSVDIATRCGQDSDCNPATVGGVLGVMHGYSKIPSFWLDPLKEIETDNFGGTDVSLNKAYELSFSHALQNIEKEGGKVNTESVHIPLSKTLKVAYEQNFTGMYPVSREKIDLSFNDEFKFSFNGNGFILYGNLVCHRNISKDYLNRACNKFGSEVFALAEPDDPYVAQIRVFIDGRQDQLVKLPMKNTSRRLEPAWKYLLPEGQHNVEIKWDNPSADHEIRINDLVVYSSSSAAKNLPE
jgi:hypothetical protein